MQVIVLVIILLLIVAMIKTGWDVMRHIDDGNIVSVLANAFYAIVCLMVVIFLVW